MLTFTSFAGQRSEGARGELAGVRGAAAFGGAESGGVGGGDRHEATGGRASRPGAGPRSGERTQPTEEEEQRAGGACTDAGQNYLLTGREKLPAMRGGSTLEIMQFRGSNVVFMFRKHSQLFLRLLLQILSSLFNDQSFF